MTKENFTELNNTEFGVDSRYKSNKEREFDAVTLMQARLNRMKNLSQKDIIRAKLLQLKLKMRKYIDDSVYDDKYNFTSFLETYIDTLYSKRRQFAKDIAISPVLLSQVINRHREPNNEFLQKLMVHSERTFKKVSEFDAKMWYQIYYSEKINEMISKQGLWRPKIEKKIKVSPSI